MNATGLTIDERFSNLKFSLSVVFQTHPVRNWQGNTMSVSNSKQDLYFNCAANTATLAVAMPLATSAASQVKNPNTMPIPLASEGVSTMMPVQLLATPQIQPVVSLVQRTDERRQLVEQFIATGFAAVYQAQIQQFMPQLLAVSARGALQAVLGVRGGQSEKLFVEQYLDADISFVLRDIGVVTTRSQIAEIGNLYAANRHFTLLLFVVSAFALHQAGFRHLVCCATPQVQTLLSRHGLQLRTLAEGDPSRLTGDASAWGTYYQSHPMVCHLDLTQAINLINAEDKLSQLTRQYWSPTQPLVDGLAQEN
jgi:hypothetical protein